MNTICREMLLELIEEDDSIDDIDLDMENSPQLPIHPSKTKRYSQYVASREDMLFLRRALLYKPHPYDLELIENNEKYYEWYAFATVDMSIWSSWFSRERLSPFSQTVPNMTTNGNTANIIEYPLNTIYSEISYANQDVRIIGKDKLISNCYIVYAWGFKEDTKPIHKYGNEILIDLVQLTIEICKDEHKLHNVLQEYIGWDDNPQHHIHNRTMGDSLEYMHDIYGTEQCEYHKVRIGLYNGKYIKDISHRYIPCNKVYKPIFTTKPIAYSDMIIYHDH